MHNRKKKWLVVLSVLCLISVAAFSIINGKQYTMHYDVITEAKLEKIKQEAKKTEELNIDLIFNNEQLPYDASSRTFFLPLSMDDTWETGEFKASIDGCAAQVLFLESFTRKDKCELIKENYAIPFIVLCDDSYQSYYIKITGVPIANFSGTEFTSADGLAIFSFDLYDYAANADWVEHCYTTSTLHGNTSLAYDKKSLRLKLLEEKDGGFEKHNADLLGMRKDDDWILNSLYADESRVRDKLSLSLWKDLGAADNPYGKSFGADGEFVEVFINDNYQGLYLLMYPIDRKQLGLESVSAQLAKGDTNVERIYKKKYTAAWQESDFTGKMPDPNMPDFRGGFYLKGDTILGDVSEWEPLRALAACIESDDMEYRSQITTLADKQNLIDNWLFYQAIAGFDNLAKNTYYAVCKSGSGLKGYFIPWDLNISFGVVYADNPYYCKADALTVKEIVKWEPGDRMIHQDVDDSIVLTKQTWQKWRKGVLSDELLKERIALLEAYVKNSGAFEREYKRWPEGNCNSDFSLIYDYAQKRMEFVDEYVDGLGQTGQ